jgi:phage-related protein
VSPKHKPLVWLRGEIRTPPFGSAARVETGFLLRQLQRGDKLSLPHSRPMPRIGRRCHELRVADDRVTWRIIYRIDVDAIVIGDIFSKKTETTPDAVIRTSQRRFKEYDDASK